MPSQADMKGSFMKRIIGACAAAIALLLTIGLPAQAGTTAVASPYDARIIEYGANAPGTDTAGNRNAEFVRFLNTTAGALDVEGWQFHDAYPHSYTLKGVNLPAGSPFRTAGPDAVPGNADDRFVMPVGGQVYLYNGAGADGNPLNNTAAIYRNYIHHFNNAGDTMYLRDAGGGLVHWVKYTPYRVRIG